MKKISTLSFMVVAAVGLFFTSCKKTDLSFDENDKTIAQENAVAQQHFADVAGIADEASSKEGFTNFRRMTNCASTVKDTLLNGTVTATITFDGTTCNDGKKRSGKVIIAYSGLNYKVTGTSASITFNGYKVENTMFSGTVVLVNTTPQGVSSPLKFTLTVDATLTEGSQSSKFATNITKTWDLGTDANSGLDDVYLLDGSASGTTFNGTKYTATITSQLKKFADYRCIVQGKIELVNKTSTSTSTKVIDFGTGTRDAKATITVGTVTKEIDL